MNLIFIFFVTVCFYVFVLLMLSVAEGYGMTNFSSQPTKLVKNKNEDISLRCSLLDKHEKYNQQTHVTWYFKRTCKSCWNNPEEDEWDRINCVGPCKLSLNLNDENASNGFYLCKIFPYHISDHTVLQIEVTKTFQLDIFGKNNRFNSI